MVSKHKAGGAVKILPRILFIDVDHKITEVVAEFELPSFTMRKDLIIWFFCSRYKTEKRLSGKDAETNRC